MPIDRFRLTLLAIAAAALCPSAIAATGSPVGWGALSGLAADPRDPDLAYAVSDNFHAVSRILTLDVGQTPARLVGRVTLTRNGLPQGYDLEGIASRPDGGFWAVSEGRIERGRHNLLLRVAADGAVEAEIGLPDVVEAEATRYGFEGVAAWDGKAVIVIQRPWRDDPDHHVKLAIYDPASAAWSFVRYELSRPARGVRVSLSGITAIGGGRFLVLERDHEKGGAAAHKVVTLISLEDIEPVPFGNDLPVVEKTVVADLLPLMRAGNRRIPEKPEGLTVTADGRVLIVIDNDGAAAPSGEGLLLTVGTLDELM